jgi:CelD/BcsL family acetyltransferase involved in cellulose biosynthesis
MRSPYVPIESDWETYWQERSRNLRKSLRRSENRLAQLGKVSMEISEGGDDLDRLLEEGFRVEASGWKGQEGTAIISTPETERFYRQIAYWGVETGMLRLAFLRVGEKPIAFAFSLETADRHYVWKLGHDADLDQVGPGRVLIARTIERAFSMGFKSYEFLGSADEYKLRWAPRSRELMRAQAFAGTLPGTAERLAQTHGRALARRVLRRSGPAGSGE